VDGAVIIVESVVHRISRHSGSFEGIDRLSQKQMDENVHQSAQRMMSSATFGQIIILIVYLPIMALVGTEGKMFRPMAQVVTFALIGAALLSLTYVPMASALFLSKKTHHKKNFSDKLMGKLHQVFNPMILFALKHKLAVTIGAVALLISSLFVFSRLGGEFIPQLEEGDLASGVMTLQGGSLSNTIDQVIKANKILLDNFPEVKHAVCKIGAGEIPTDPTPMETGDYIITLKDKSEWTSAKTREELVEKMEEKLVALAGVKFEFQQPIQMRFNELMSGSKQDIAIKIFGDDLNILAEKAAQVERIIQRVPGVEDINVEKVTGLAQLQVEYNRDRLAQYGLSVADVNSVLRAAFAGSQAGVVFDEEKRFALVVRLDKDYRKNIDDIKNLTVTAHNGLQIPFEQLADISVKSGPAQVSREETKRRITIGFNVRNRDVKSVIHDVSGQIDQRIQMPTGYYVTYGGQFQNLEAAQKRLSIAVPIALLMIFILLYFTFHSVKQSLLIFTAVPMSAIGGIFALWIRGMNFSISAGVGFIALFGVAVLNGIVLIAEFNRLEQEGITDIRERVLQGLHTRLRPVVVTAAVASLGFLPMALSTSAGAEVQKPLATVVIGGLITATLLTLIVLPIFYVFFSSPRTRSRLNGRKGLLMVLLLAGSALFSQTANAQQEKTMTLHDAIQTALDHNLTIRSASYSVDAQQALKKAAIDIPKTAIDGQYGQFNSYSNDNSWSVTQSLAFPSVYIRQNQLAKEHVQQAAYQLDVSKMETATRVKQLYWQLVYLKEKKKLLLWQDSLYSRFLRAAELRAQSGETNRLEMITARSQSLEISNQLFQITSDMAVLSRQLGVILNSDVPVIPDEKGLSRRSIRIVPDSLAIENNPWLAQVRQQVAVAQKETMVARSQWLPDISVGYFNQSIVGTQDINGIPKSFNRGYRFTGIQGGITVPVWYRAVSAKAKSAKINESAARTDAENYYRSLLNSYQSLMDEYRKFSATVDYYENQAVPEANTIIDQANLSYKGGALDYLDYVLMLGRALTIRQNALDALNNYNQTMVSIENVMGQLF